MFTNSSVSSPTLFQFADGAALSIGAAGEAGPEAIMPLSRGRGGRLGVDASGMMSDSRDALQQASQEVAASREALQQVSEGGGSETGSNGYTPQSKLFAESRQALATSTRSQSVTTSSSSAPLKIETIRIGNLDVVTVEQAKAIADASSVRGNAKQTRLLQSSPSARRSMGI
jgi:phage-related minor tail protein